MMQVQPDFRMRGTNLATLSRTDLQRYACEPVTKIGKSFTLFKSLDCPEAEFGADCCYLSSSQIDFYRRHGCQFDTGAEIPGYRPLRYNRSCLIETPFGIVDVKGCGLPNAKTPDLGHHNNGMLYLDHALHEYFMQSVIDFIFAREGVPIFTNETYCLNRLPFSFPHAQLGALPLVQFLRKASLRQADGQDLYPPDSIQNRLTIEAELVLRRYGVTSSNVHTRIFVEEMADGDLSLRFGYYSAAYRKEYRDLIAKGIAVPFVGDGINIQLCEPVDAAGRSAVLIDFGHYEFRERFVYPLAAFSKTGPEILSDVIACDAQAFDNRLKPGFFAETISALCAQPAFSKVPDKYRTDFRRLFLYLSRLHGEDDALLEHAMACLLSIVKTRLADQA